LGEALRAVATGKGWLGKMLKSDQEKRLPVPDENFLLSPKELVSRRMREEKKLHKSAVFWFTGLSGSGKSTVAHGVEKKLFDLGIDAVVFDGDAIRTGLCNDLRFSPPDRLENIRRIAEVSRLFVHNNIICKLEAIWELRKEKTTLAAIGKPSTLSTKQYRNYQALNVNGSFVHFQLRRGKTK